MCIVAIQTGIGRFLNCWVCSKKLESYRAQKLMAGIQAPPKNWFERWKNRGHPKKCWFGKWILLKMPKNIQIPAIICSDWWFVNRCFGNVLDHFSWWLGNRGICRLQPKGIQVTPGYPPNPSSKQTWNELGEKGLSKVGETFSNSNIFWSFTPKKLGEDLYFHPFWLTLRHIFFKWVVAKNATK